MIRFAYINPHNCAKPRILSQLVYCLLNLLYVINGRHVPHISFETNNNEYESDILYGQFTTSWSGMGTAAKRPGYIRIYQSQLKNQAQL